MTNRVALVSVLVVASVAAAMPSRAEEPPALLELELHSAVFQNTRAVRVLLPPGYYEPANRERRYPVVVFTDGVAALDGRGWGLKETARELWAEGRLEEVLFVAVDNGGSTTESTDPVKDRAAEYMPFADPSWEPSTAPEPRGRLFPPFLFDEVLPLVDGAARTRPGEPIVLAGSSYGAAAVLYAAITHPDRVRGLLLESPSLHLGGGRLLELVAAANSLPERIYIGAGTAEGDTEATRRAMVEDARSLARLVAEAPSVESRLLIEPGATHWYDAWRERLPEALLFLLGTERNR